MDVRLLHVWGRRTPFDRFLRLFGSARRVVWTKPVVAPARWHRLQCFGLDVRITQPHGRFEMRQIGATLIRLTLKMFDRGRGFQSLVAQGRDNWRARRGSPGRTMPSEEHSGSSPAPGEVAGGGCYGRPRIHAHE